MASFVVRRLLQAVVVVFIVVTITFILIRIAPGDPFTRSLESARLNRESIEAQRRLYGLDQPVLVQYVRYVGSVARGDFGFSFYEAQPVLRSFAARIPDTLLLAGVALLIDFSIGIALGLWQGLRAGSRADRATSILTLSIYSAPTFWVGMILLLVFSVGLGWFPSGGAFTVTGTTGGALAELLDRLHHLVLPAFTLGIVGACGTARYQRAAVIETVHRPFVLTARARGLPRRRMVVHHVLRSSLLPTLTLLGMSLPVLISGSVLVERLFGWPGMGNFLVESVTRRDYPVVTGGAILIAAIVVVGNLVADLTQRIIDPRSGDSA